MVLCDSAPGPTVDFCRGLDASFLPGSNPGPFTAHFFDLLQADKPMRLISVRECSVFIQATVVAVTLGAGFCTTSVGDEPDPKTYWDVKDVRPGMKGVGRTVM